MIDLKGQNLIFYSVSLWCDNFTGTSKILCDLPAHISHLEWLVALLRFHGPSLHTSAAFL